MSELAKIPSSEHVQSVCKPGAGHECCRYLTMGAGWLCAKGTGVGHAIDARSVSMGAQGDNCSGAPDFAPVTA